MVCCCMIVMIATPLCAVGPLESVRRPRRGLIILHQPHATRAPPAASPLPPSWLTACSVPDV